MPIKIVECKTESIKSNGNCLEVRNAKMTIEFKNEDLVEEIIQVIKML